MSYQPRGAGGRDRGGRGRGGDRGRGVGDRGRGGYPSREPDRVEVFGSGTFPPPNQDVEHVEDDYMRRKTTVAQGMAGVSLTDNFPARPAYGTKGKPVVLWTNYFELTPAKNLVLYRYSASVLPEAKGRKLRRLFELLIQDPRFARSVTDFKSILVNRNQLEDVEVEVAYRSELEDEPQPNTRPYRIKVQGTGQIEVAALLNFLGSTQADPNFSQGKQLQIIQTLNILLGYYPQSNPSITTIAGNKHFSFGIDQEEFNLGGGLNALRGYFRSVRMGTARLLVNINVSHAVFFKPGPLEDLIDTFARTHGRNLLQLDRFLKKVRVETTHLPVKKNKAGTKIPRIKMISSLATNNDGFSLPHPPQVARFGASPKEVKFWLDSNSPESSLKTSSKKLKAPPKASAGYITVYDFFQKVHNLTIKNPEIPVMNVGNRENPMYMPAEYCIVLPGQSSMKKLGPDQTASMIRFACRRPFQNAKSITSNGPGVLGFVPTTNSLLASFGVNVSTSMITVPGRVLSAPTIKYRGNDTEVPRGGSWNMSKVRFTTGATVPGWTYLWIQRAGRAGLIDKKSLQPVLTRFHEMMKICGLTAPAPMEGPPPIVLDVPNATQTNDQIIVDMIKKIATHETKKVGLIFVLLPDTDAAVYNRVKYAADILYGVHTVGSVDAKLWKDKGRDQYLANIALKVNSKLLGVNQSLDLSKLGIIAEGKTMVVGIDVTHPSPGSLSNAPSVAAVVASTDKNLSQFPCELRIQEGRQEMVTDLTEMFKSRLNIWRARNRSLPENILVYRDGVSEGQYQILLDTEIPSLRAACKLAYPADQQKKGFPKISVIVVGKRHHTRFFATKENEMDRSGNPMNGTVVDRGVTSMWNWDFFLQAHTCLQGTAKPAHYYVVLDEIFGKGNLKKPHPFPSTADTLEDLTHNMCYLFARATKAVSICPPAYYADLACERARCYLSGVFDPATPGGSSVTGGAQPTARPADVTIHERLRNSMFYL